jgi:hypothetical protein
MGKKYGAFPLLSLLVAAVLPAALEATPPGLILTADWTTESNQAGAYLGAEAIGVGDVNGDGYDDVMVGIRLYDHGQVDEGAVFVYYGSAAGLSTTPSWTAEGNQSNAHFSESLGTAGDVNGDGYDDIIVGARYYDNGQPDEGAAFAYYGSAAGLSPTANWMGEIDQAGGQFWHPGSDGRGRQR